MPSKDHHRFLLLTYPRTASHLLTQILALKNQPSILPSERDGYFFLPTMGPRFKTSDRPINQWTPPERTARKSGYQISVDALSQHIQTAKDQGKNVYVKEHAPWLVEPVAECKWVFGPESTADVPWMIDTKAFGGHQSRGANNETVLPDEVLRTFLPTFLIRHPALVFPSLYRTTLDLEGPEVTEAKLVTEKLEMTLHWSRTLYDHYDGLLDGKVSDGDEGIRWPVVLDADDIINSPDVVVRYSKMVGLDTTKLQFSWASASEEELGKTSKMERRMKSTIQASSGIVKGKAANDLNIDEEVKKWKEEFGEEPAERLEKYARAAMPDYEYMRERRLKSD